VLSGPTCSSECSAGADPGSRAGPGDHRYARAGRGRRPSKCLQSPTRLRSVGQELRSQTLFRPPGAMAGRYGVLIQIPIDFRLKRRDPKEPPPHEPLALRPFMSMACAKSSSSFWRDVLFSWTSAFQKLYQIIRSQGETRRFAPSLPASSRRSSSTARSSSRKADKRATWRVGREAALEVNRCCGTAPPSPRHIKLVERAVEARDPHRDRPSWKPRPRHLATTAHGRRSSPAWARVMGHLSALRYGGIGGWRLARGRIAGIAER